MLKYRIIARKTSDFSGLESTTVEVDKKIYTIKDTRKLDTRELIMAIYNAMIQSEPSMGKKQDIARERHYFELASY